MFASIRKDGAYVLYKNNKIRNIDDDLILELNGYQPPQKIKIWRNEILIIFNPDTNNYHVKAYNYQIQHNTNQVEF